MPDVTGNTAIDVAIGLAFTYLLFSLLCSAIQEGIAGILDLRAKKLEAGLRSMLDDHGHGTGGAPVIPGSEPTAGPEPSPAAAQPENRSAAAATAACVGTSLIDQVLAHDLVRSAYKDSLVTSRSLLKKLPFRKRRGPSYLAARTFATALLDLLAPADAGDDPLKAIEQQIALAGLPKGTRSTLLTMVKHVEKDRDHLRAVIEQWFDDTMARVSGWYKRQAQIILCLIAVAVTIGLNVNTVSIAERTIHDSSLRTYLVDQATKEKPEAGKDKIGQRITKAHTAGLPFGWHEEKNNPAKVGGHVGRAIAGWLLTIVALSLGAPFWFDALSRLARLRTTGVPEAPHEQAPRKDAPTSVVTTVKRDHDDAVVERTTTTTMPG